MRKGTKMTIESIRKSVETRKRNGNCVAWNKGKPAPWAKNNAQTFKKGQTPFNKGKKLSKIHCENLRLSHIGKMTGENSPSWKGGVSPVNNLIRGSVEYKLWNNAVYAKDGYTCQKTGQIGGKLVAHHILNFSSHPELRFAIDNGVTLSKEAHEEFHKLYGKRNNSREQLEEFLNKKNV